MPDNEPDRKMQRHARVFLVSGRVQGVGYRFFVERQARELGLRGYVRNLSDGRVEVYAIGDDAALERLRERLREGPPASRVERLEERVAAVRPYRDFLIEASGDAAV